MPGLPLVIVAHPVAKLTPDGVAEIAAGAVAEVIRISESDAGGLQAEFKAKPPPTHNRLRYHSMFEGNYNAPDAAATFKGPDAPEAINKLLYSRGWTDGLPIVPPTPERCEKMLAENGLDSQEEIGPVEPQLGIATVGKVAANAVMAGCEPEHLPVVLAAVRAMIQEPMNLKAIQTTTHPCTVGLMVNGPITQALDINGAYNAFGQGVMANAVIGRAVRHVLINVGGATPGILDRATAGSPAKYSFCFAENEAASPWEPLHVERGFKPDQSTVTAMGCEGPHNVNDHYGTTAEEVLLTIAGVMATPGANNSYLDGEIMVALGPEHAEIVANGGFSKDEVKDFLIRHAIVPAWHINEPQMELYKLRAEEKLVDGGKGGLHVVSDRSHLIVAVVGGAGRHSQIIPSFGTTLSVTEPI